MPAAIRINAVALGIVETDMSEFAKTDQGRKYAMDMQALKRVAQPDDVGDALAFLARTTPDGSQATFYG